MKIKGLFLLLLFLLMPNLALANTTSDILGGSLGSIYYTYGEIGPIVVAFNMISLIFVDGQYKILVKAIAILGIIVGIFTVYSKVALGGKGGIGSWAIPIIAGLTIYVAFFSVTTGNGYSFVVHDLVLYKAEPVNELPLGIAVVAMVANKIEKGFIDIIDSTVITSGEAYSYTTQAGGAGFDLLLKATSSNVTWGDNYMDATMEAYGKRCVLADLAMPSPKINANEMTRGTGLTGIADLKTQFAKANSQSRNTLYYDATTSGYQSGVSMSCYDAWILIKTNIYTPANAERIEKTICKQAGFDVGGTASTGFTASGLQKCREVLEATAKFATGIASLSAQQILYQSATARNFGNMLSAEAPDTVVKTLGDNAEMTSLSGAGVMMNSWLSASRSVLTAIILIMLPFMVLFIPTPLASKVIGLFIGFFIWLTCWGIADAGICALATHYSTSVFSEIKDSGFSYYSVMSTPSASVKSLAMFGVMRGAAVTFAGIFTGLFVKFAGQALASQASGIIQKQEGYGRTAAEATTAEGRAKKEAEMVQASAGIEHANHFSHEMRANAQKAAMAMSQMQGTAQAEVRKEYGDEKIQDNLNKEAFAGQGHKEGLGKNPQEAARASKLAAQVATESTLKAANKAGSDPKYVYQQSNKNSFNSTIDALANEEVMKKHSEEELGHTKALETDIKQAGMDLKQKMANLYTKGDVGELQNWIDKGMYLDEDQAATFRAAGYKQARAGMNVNKFSSVNTKTGALEGAKFDLNSKGVTGNYAGGILTEKFNENGMETERKTNDDGKVISKISRRELQEERTDLGKNSFGKTITGLRGTKVEDHSGQKKYTGAFAVEGMKEPVDGTLTMAADGRFVRFDASGGTKEEQEKINRRMNDTSTKSVTGVSSVDDSYTQNADNGFIYQGSMRTFTMKDGTKVGQFTGNITDKKGNTYQATAGFQNGQPVRTDYKSGASGENKQMFTTSVVLTSKDGEAIKRINKAFANQGSKQVVAEGDTVSMTYSSPTDKNGPSTWSINKGGETAIIDHTKITTGKITTEDLDASIQNQGTATHGAPSARIENGLQAVGFSRTTAKAAGAAYSAAGEGAADIQKFAGVKKLMTPVKATTIENAKPSINN